MAGVVASSGPSKSAQPRWSTSGPRWQPSRCLFDVFAVDFGHVLGLDAVAPFVLGAQVAGRALVVVEARRGS